MGFGDVTLMAMIGSFLGWQAMPIIFFLAPLAGLVVGLVQWFVYRDNVIPYGPFLCLATLGVFLLWGPIWLWAMPLYAEPWLVPAVIAGPPANPGRATARLAALARRVGGAD